MNKLATKRTSKNTKYRGKKKALAKKLSNIAQNVAKKKIYIVKKTDPGYDIINYVTKDIIVENIPFLTCANSVCKEYNKTQETLGVNSLQRHVDIYYKHFNDLQFYKHTVRTSKDKVRVFSAGVRMQESLHFIKEAKKHLSNF